MLLTPYITVSPANFFIEPNVKNFGQRYTRKCYSKWFFFMKSA